jgi:hypothetical protein
MNDTTANPYAAPRAALADLEETTRGRPVLVWIITVVLGFGVVFSAISTMPLLAGSPIGGEAVGQQLSYLRPFDHVVSLVVALVSLLALIALFRLKRSALPLFIGAFALGLANVGLNSAFRPEYRAAFQFPGAYWSLAVGGLINLAIIAYIWRLSARGNLC